MEFLWPVEHAPSFSSSERHTVMKFQRFRNDPYRVTEVDSDPFQISVTLGHWCRIEALATEQQYTANENCSVKSVDD